MAYAKTAPMVHCLAFSGAGPIGEHGACDKRTKTATESSKKMAYAKTAQTVHCLAFSVAGPIGEHGACDKRTKTATESSKKMAYAKTAQTVHCRPGACFFLWQVLWKSKTPAISAQNQPCCVILVQGTCYMSLRSTRIHLEHFQCFNAHHVHIKGNQKHAKTCWEEDAVGTCVSVLYSSRLLQKTTTQQENKHHAVLM